MRLSLCHYLKCSTWWDSGETKFRSAERSTLIRVSSRPAQGSRCDATPTSAAHAEASSPASVPADAVPRGRRRMVLAIHVVALAAFAELPFAVVERETQNRTLLCCVAHVPSDRERASGPRVVLAERGAACA